MATAKKGARSAAPAKKSAATKKSSPKAKLTAADVLASLEAQKRSELPEKLRHTVEDLLAASQRLERHAKRLREHLLKKSRLSEAVLDSFTARIDALAEADAQWQKLRARGVSKALKDARVEGARLRHAAITNLRHFFEDDSALGAKLDEIVEGDGDVDLVSDLKALAPIVDERWETIGAAAELPTSRGDAFREAAKKLSNASLDAGMTAEGRAALELRDKAFFWLYAAEQEIRACGRHAFREDTKLRELFADSLDRRPRKPRKAGDAPPAS